MFQFVLSKEFHEESTDFLIVPDKQKIMQSITSKIILSMTFKVPIISIKWIFDCIKENKIIHYTGYRILSKIDHHNKILRQEKFVVNPSVCCNIIPLDKVIPRHGGIVFKNMLEAQK